MDIFIKEYRHTVPLIWFDIEMKPVTNIDVYNHPFPMEEGFLSIRQGNFELLILKLESNDSIKEKAIRGFLNIKDFKLIRANVGQDKDYGWTYRHFLQTVKLPKSYVEIMCNSKFTRHFYSDAEIEVIRSNWLDHSNSIDLPSIIRQELIRASFKGVK